MTTIKLEPVVLNGQVEQTASPPTLRLPVALDLAASVSTNTIDTTTTTTDPITVNLATDDPFDSLSCDVFLRTLPSPSSLFVPLPGLLDTDIESPDDCSATTTTTAAAAVSSWPPMINNASSYDLSPNSMYSTDSEPCASLGTWHHVSPPQSHPFVVQHHYHYPHHQPHQQQQQQQQQQHQFSPVLYSLEPNHQSSNFYHNMSNNNNCGVAQDRTYVVNHAGKHDASVGTGDPRYKCDWNDYDHAQQARVSLPSKSYVESARYLNDMSSGNNNNNNNSTGPNVIPSNNNYTPSSGGVSQTTRAPVKEESFKLVEKPPAKKSRTKYTKEQTESLESSYWSNAYPDMMTIDVMSRSLGINKEKINIWFQNRRARNKRATQTTNFNTASSSSASSFSTSS